MEALVYILSYINQTLESRLTSCVCVDTFLHTILKQNRLKKTTLFQKIYIEQIPTKKWPFSFASVTNLIQGLQIIDTFNFSWGHRG